MEGLKVDAYSAARYARSREKAHMQVNLITLLLAVISTIVVYSLIGIIEEGDDKKFCVALGVNTHYETKFEQQTCWVNVDGTFVPASWLRKS